MATKRKQRVRSRLPYAETTQFLGSGDVEARAEFARTIAFANLNLADGFSFAELRREREREAPHILRFDVQIRPPRPSTGAAIAVYDEPPASMHSEDFRAYDAFVDEFGVPHIDAGDICACDAFVEEIGRALHANARNYDSVRAALNPPQRPRPRTSQRAPEYDAPGVGYHAGRVCRAPSGFRTNQSVRDAQRIVRGVLDALIDGNPQRLQDLTRGMSIDVTVVAGPDIGRRNAARPSPLRPRGRDKRVDLYPQSVWTTFQPAPGVKSFLFGIVLAARESLLHRLFRCKACARYVLARDDRLERQYCARSECYSAATAKRAPGKTDPEKRKRNRDDQTARRRRGARWAKLKSDIDKALVKEARTESARPSVTKERGAAKAETDQAIAAAKKNFEKLFPKKSPARRQAAAFLKGLGARS